MFKLTVGAGLVNNKNGQIKIQIKSKNNQLFFFIIDYDSGMKMYYNDNQALYCVHRPHTYIRFFFFYCQFFRRTFSFNHCILNELGIYLLGSSLFLKNNIQKKENFALATFFGEYD